MLRSDISVNVLFKVNEASQAKLNGTRDICLFEPKYTKRYDAHIVAL